MRSLHEVLYCRIGRFAWGVMASFQHPVLGIGVACVSLIATVTLYLTSIFIGHTLLARVTEYLDIVTIQVQTTKAAFCQYRGVNQLYELTRCMAPCSW